MTSTLIYVVGYFAISWITACGLYAYMRRLRKIRPITVTRSVPQKLDAVCSMMLGLIPVMWLVVPFGTGFYAAGFRRLGR